MLYTSYYANVKKLGNIVPICISQKIPFYASKLKRYRALAPSWEIINSPSSEYVKLYYELILRKLQPFEVLNDLSAIANNKEFALICYEGPGKFCHRHIVADWLQSNTGVQFEEYDIKKNYALF